VQPCALPLCRMCLNTPLFLSLSLSLSISLMAPWPLTAPLPPGLTAVCPLARFIVAPHPGPIAGCPLSGPLGQGVPLSLSLFRPSTVPEGYSCLGTFLSPLWITCCSMQFKCRVCVCVCVCACVSDLALGAGSSVSVLHRANV